MNGRARIVATLAGDPVDRRAFAPVLSLYGARLTKTPLTEYYTNPAAYAAGQMAVAELFEPDLLLTPFAFALIGAAFGSRLAFTPHGPPNIRHPALFSPHEWDTLTPPDPEVNPHLLYLREATRLLVQGGGEAIPVAACLPGPMDIPPLVMGMEGWLETLLFDPDGARRILEISGRFFARLANALFAEGALVAIVTCAYASPTVLWREPVKSLICPALHSGLTEVRGPVLLHDGGGELLPHLDMLVGFPSVVGFALNPRDGLTLVRRIAGKGTLLVSGPQGPVLPALAADKVERGTREILWERGRCCDRHFILGTCGGDIPLDTPPENIDAMRRALTSVGWDLDEVTHGR